MNPATANPHWAIPRRENAGSQRLPTQSTCCHPWFPGHCRGDLGSLWACTSLSLHLPASLCLWLFCSSLSPLLSTSPLPLSLSAPCLPLSFHPSLFVSAWVSVFLPVILFLLLTSFLCFSLGCYLPFFLFTPVFFPPFFLCLIFSLTVLLGDFPHLSVFFLSQSLPLCLHLSRRLAHSLYPPTLLLLCFYFCLCFRTFSSSVSFSLFIACSLCSLSFHFVDGFLCCAKAFNFH